MAFAETARKKFRTLVGLPIATALGRVSINQLAITAHTTISNTFKIPGTRVGDIVMVTVESGADGTYVQSAVISAANTCTLKLANATAGNLGGGGQLVLNFLVLRG